VSREQEREEKQQQLNNYLGATVLLKQLYRIQVS